MIRVLLLLIFLLISTVLSFNAQSSGFIVHANTPVDSISSKKLRLIYTLRYRQWSNDLGVKVFILNEDSTQHKQFVKKELKLFSHHLRKIWDRALFSGLGQEPIQLNTDQGLIDMVAGHPGSIAYISGDVPENTLIKPLKIRNQ